MEKRVHIVVVTFNRCELLRECLQALLSQSYHNYQIYLINNASTDGTEEMIQNEFSHPNITYYNTGENLGGAGGFHFGMKKAALNDCDYIWLMDDDTIVHEDSLERLIACANSLSDNFGFLSSNVRFTDGSPCKMNIPTLLHDKKKRGREWLNQYDPKEEGNTLPIAHATFVSFFVKTAIVKEVGLPIKEFFIWSDDTEYSLRISAKYPCYFCGDSIVTHKMKVNANTSVSDFLNCSEDRLPRYFYAYRNRFYVAKHQGVKKTIFYIGKIFITTFQILFQAKSGKGAKLKLLWNAFFKGFGFNPPVEYVTSKE